MRRGALAWGAIVLPVWSVLVYCTYREPVMHDGWGHYVWHLHNDLSLGSLWDFFTSSYVQRNPRLGQTFTLLQHTPGLHPVVTPLIELALFYLLAVLVLGRRPSLRRSEDALLFATIIAMVFACVRALGPMLFYRPYSGNYVFGLVVNLAWIVPYRLHAEQPRRWRWWWSPSMVVLGVASGLCNEHTGPALIVAAGFAVVMFWRRGERFVPWAWLGLAGMIAGTVLLYLAPGQEVRYLGLATQQSLLERVVARGVVGNLQIIGLYVAHCALLLPWIVLGIIAHRRRGAPAQPRALAVVQRAALAIAVLIVLTLLASPKHGDRLYFASLSLTSAATAGWLVGRLGRAGRIAAAVFAAITIAYVSLELVVAYHRVGREFEARLATIHAAQKGTPLVVPAYSQARTRYVLGDDFAKPRIRARVARWFELPAIELASPPADGSEDDDDDDD